jgi:hypothetical protein
VTAARKVQGQEVRTAPQAEETSEEDRSCIQRVWAAAAAAKEVQQRATTSFPYIWNFVIYASFKCDEYFMYIDSVVGIATSFWLDDRGVRVQVPVGPRIFSSLDRPDRL